MTSSTISRFAKLNNPSLFIEAGFIKSEWVTYSENKTFPVYEPATEAVLGNVPNFSRADFRVAIEDAQKGFIEYSENTLATQRGALLRKWYDLVMTNVDDLAIILCLENGKTLAEARGEVEYAASFIKWFAEEAPRTYGETIPSAISEDTFVYTVREPIGVCAIITPWNFPAAMITRKIAPALAAGCSVVIKPPSETPFSCLAFTKLAVEAGIPSDCIQVLTTKDRDASAELVENPLVKKVSFTGSTGVGKALTKASAQTMKKVSMELGGNAPFIVFEDADLEKAIDGVLVCKYRCTGQTCVCANRIYVHQDVLEEFTSLLLSRVENFRCGSGLDSTVTHGPLVNGAAVDKVHQHVEDALAKGGKLLHGGKPLKVNGKGFFYEPTIITNCTRDMLVTTDETFGPLAAIYPFTTEPEVIEAANDTEFGLAGYFFSKDINRVKRVAKKLKVGMMGVNTGKISAAETPFGGIKESGVGREGSLHGIAEYMVIKSVTVG